MARRLIDGITQDDVMERLRGLCAVQSMRKVAIHLGVPSNIVAWAMKTGAVYPGLAKAMGFRKLVVYEIMRPLPDDGKRVEVPQEMTLKPVETWRAKHRAAMTGSVEEEE